MSNQHDTRYLISLSLEEAAFGCQKVVKIKTSQDCSSCDGSGEGSAQDLKTCPKCRGVGQIYQLHPILVQIPAGVEDGYNLRISPEGQFGLKGQVSEGLNVVVSIKAHKLFQRSGDDIIYELPLGFPQAALGSEVMVPALKDSVKLKIPPGTQTGKLFCLKGKGIPHFGRRGKGDLLVKVRVVTPTLLDKHQRQLLEQLAETLF